MATLQIASVFAIVVFHAACQNQFNQLHVNDTMENEKKCVEMSKKPYFDVDQVVGRSWRVYYSWTMPMENECLDIHISNATATITKRFHNDMHEYLQDQPEWDAAMLYMNVGRGNHEMLLFADHQGAAGSFIGIANVIKNSDISPMKKGVPLFKLFLKLLYKGKYLLMLDCHIGVASLASSQRKPLEKEVKNVAKFLNIGEGNLACTSDLRKTKAKAACPKS